MYKKGGGRDSLHMSIRLSSKVRRGSHFWLSVASIVYRQNDCGFVDRLFNKALARQLRRLIGDFYIFDFVTFY